MIDSVIEVHDLTVAYDSVPVLWDVDLSIPRGSLVAIVGPNGAGKSTLIKSMVGLVKPVTGAIHMNTVFKEGGGISYVPQTDSVDWDFPTTVLDVVCMGRYGSVGWFKRIGKKDVSIAEEMLKRVGMLEFKDRQISKLSGGQKQRVFLARALVQDSDIYFMDEPLKGVDVHTEKTIMRLFRELKEEGKTVVVVHHDLSTVKEYFDWVVFINLRVIAKGPVDKVFNESNISKSYRNRIDILRGNDDGV